MTPLTHTLPNGLRIVHTPSISPVAYCGIAVKAGSRDDADKPGLAHFVEHTIFKGTTNRRAHHIINRMERVGGELNAYTSKEDTFVYSIFPCRNYPRALELIGDLIANSVFPDAELDKEREVVLDEIASYRDMPSEAVYDDFEDAIFAGSGLGHNILGTEASLNSLHSADCRDFIDRLYTPDNMVLFSLGDISFDRLCRLAEKHFGALNRTLQRADDCRAATSRVTPFATDINIGSHQVHSIYGVPIFNIYDRRRHALSLLNNIIGGPGMNSLLNIELRERRGYVYTVESASTLFTDTGLWSVYFGCDHDQRAACLRLIGRCLDRLADAPLTERQLRMAKRQYAGQLLVAAENAENQALAIGKAMLYFNRASSIEETSQIILALTAEELQSVAQLLRPQYASVLNFV